ncbi:MAG: N-formylglutamate amidohydrolase [Marinibacterium sp.]|nr:N-formylglutamate amidohydrolase [Marinibacterium sp.]
MTRGLTDIASKRHDPGFGPAAEVIAAAPDPQILVVCEHASNRVPAALGDLGLSAPQLQSHIAWDPGAAGVARALAGALNAPLVLGQISRLVFDCNRPPDAPDAMPSRSEIHDIPGNRNLDDAARAARIAGVHDPFRAALSEVIARHRDTLRLMVTVHSFTPIYRGVPRKVELGLLHGRDDRFARAMLAQTPPGWAHLTRLNEPYSAADGVAHTLDVQGAKNGLLSVMLEIRNDLIARTGDQDAWGQALAPWISGTLSQIRERGIQ